MIDMAYGSLRLIVAETNAQPVLAQLASGGAAMVKAYSAWVSIHRLQDHHTSRPSLSSTPTRSVSGFSEEMQLVHLLQKRGIRFRLTGMSVIILRTLPMLEPNVH
jgi:hypothetical protein